MASNYTEESLKSYNKQQLIKLFWKCNNNLMKLLSKLTNEIKLLKENYKKLESDISVFKTVSSLLTDQMNNVERQCWANAQYSRCEFLEVVGIPSLVNIKDLEGKLSIVFNIIGVTVKPDDVEVCHRLYNDKKQLSDFRNVNSVNKFCE